MTATDNDSQLQQVPQPRQKPTASVVPLELAGCNQHQKLQIQMFHSLILNTTTSPYCEIILSSNCVPPKF